jgi:hypothetical protein
MLREKMTIVIRLYASYMMKTMKSMGHEEDKLTFDTLAPATTLHLYFALMRKKENPTVTKPLVMRQIIHNPQMDLAVLTARIQSVPGVWRLYETINARDVAKARKALLIELIKDETGKFNDRIDSLWKTCLMQPENKAEHNFLVDIDTADPCRVAEILQILDGINVTYEQRKTVNGWHLKTPKFDTRVLTDVPDVEIKHDSLFFIKVVDTRPPVIDGMDIDNLQP